jgi:hypothetical protein
MIFLIGLFYNLFIHNLISFVYRNTEFEKKVQISSTIIIIIGIIGYIIGKYIIDNDIVSKGLIIGGLFLIITTVIGNWEYISDEIKIIFLGIGFGYLIYLAYNYKNILLDKN